uniref:Uncharacterized protein n=1 Tax=Nelumbo nucifera TaxID=4432 RepID=A0A822ZNU7_NELNU|nr:TPA_asm: hypothetical protein HUJ06_003405 [Nelumbo nucifera]
MKDCKRILQRSEHRFALIEADLLEYMWLRWYLLKQQVPILVVGIASLNLAPNGKVCACRGREERNRRWMHGEVIVLMLMGAWGSMISNASWGFDASLVMVN